jgi:hypothetical protein
MCQSATRQLPETVLATPVGKAKREKKEKANKILRLGAAPQAAPHAKQKRSKTTPANAATHTPRCIKNT